MDPATLTVGILTGLVALVGIADAAYFVGVAYRWFRPDARWIPQVCRMDEDTCASIVDTRYGRVLGGVPNAVFGLAWYVIALGAAGWILVAGHLPTCTLFLIAAAGVVMFSVYLIWALVEKLDVPCPLCYLGHGLNLSLLILYTLACSLA